MNWYYVRDGQQDGPHSDEAIQAFLNSGQISAATLVWRDGMDTWQPLAQAAPQFFSAAGPIPQAPPLAVGVTCSECGGSFPASEMISVGGANVCARCKPLRLQKIREGLPTGNRAEELQRLLKIAKGQRGVNMAILLSFVGYAFILMLGGTTAPPARGPVAPSAAILPFVGLLVMVAAAVFQMICVYKLASSLGHTAIVWLLGVLFLPCINLILLLILSSRATKELRNGGFQVGLLGGNPKEIERQLHGT